MQKEPSLAVANGTDASVEMPRHPFRDPSADSKPWIIETKEDPVRQQQEQVLRDAWTYRDFQF
jgi:hypothetical protein